VSFTVDGTNAQDVELALDRKESWFVANL
jgi:hypothetical protein